jgi:RNA polymerase sigma-70 factor (ECF subfamily)
MISPQIMSEVLVTAFEMRVAPLPAVFVELLDQLATLGYRTGGAPASVPEAEFQRGLEAALPFLRSYGRSLTRNPEEADDLVQETVLRALAKHTLYQPGSNLRAWLATIERNLYLSGKRRTRFQGDWDDRRASMLLTTAAVQEHQMNLRDVVAALDKMSAHQREALMLVAVDDMSYDEAAAATGVCIGTVKSRVSRARQALGKLLEPEAEAPVESADIPGT